MPNQRFKTLRTLKVIGFNMDKQQKIGCAASICAIFVGFFLGFLFCFLICLCSGCRSQKSVTASVAVDSTTQSATTEMAVSTTEASTMQNISLHFDTLEMWMAPDISLISQISPTPDREGNETAETAVSRPSTSKGVRDDSFVTPFNLAELLSMSGGSPIYVRGMGANLNASSNSSAKDSETKIHADTTSNNVARQEDSNEEVDRTAVAKPPDTTWVIIVGFAILALLIYFKK